MIRVLLVDDSAVIRRLLQSALAEDKKIEVVGVAANGKIGLDQMERLKPDLIVMDVEMPVMDGLQTLAEVRKRDRNVKVIMFSTLTERGASTTLDALTLGANDYLTKPAGVGSPAAAIAYVREELVPRIHALVSKPLHGHRQVVAKTAPNVAVKKPAVPSVRRNSEGRVDLVVIGISTGGPNALAKLLPALPATLPVPVLIVQHMPEMFTRLLAERLNKTIALEICEAAEDDVLKKGVIFLAPGGYHMVLKGAKGERKIALNRNKPENHCRPSVDVMFRSALDAYGANILAVMMTGMGHDGLEATRMIREAGGQVVVQDEESSVVWGMAGSVANAGLADEVLPLDALASAIVKRVSSGQRMASGSGSRLLSRNI